MSCRCWLEQRLKIAVGPAAKGAFGFQSPARIERLTQINDHSFPLLVRELSSEIDGQSNTNRETDEVARCRPPAELDRLRCLGELLG
jgi:hypothetical protein